MIRQTSRLLFVVVLFIVQVGQTFASTIACESHDKIMMTGYMMDTAADEAMDHSHHRMTMENTGSENNSAQDCCQKDCCCPVALMSMAAIIDNYSNPSLIIQAFHLLDTNDNMASVYLALLQRPPNSPRIFTI